MDDEDSIYALATGGFGAVAIVRAEGPASRHALSRLAPDLQDSWPKDRWPVARLARLKDLEGRLLDEAIVLMFAAPHSYTGRDIVEFQLHGSPAVVDMMAQSLASLGLRAAQRGEFTRRALLAGKMPMWKAEALADLSASRTLKQARLALHAYEGRAIERIHQWRTQLMDAMAKLEACLDFPDETPHDLLGSSYGAQLQKLHDDISTSLPQSDQAQALRSGIKIALVGPVNAGKSTLFNILSREDAALVSPIAGTTRDINQHWTSLAGYPLRLSDGAGLRDGGGKLESQGIKRMKQAAEGSHLRLWLLSPATPMDFISSSGVNIEPHDVVFVNKADMGDRARKAQVRWQEHLGREVGLLSAHDSHDIVRQSVEKALEASLERMGWGWDHPTILTQRHRKAAQQALDHLQPLVGTLWQVAALSHQTAQLPVELAAESLRAAAHALGEITGPIHNDDVLDALFSQFCLGK